MIHARPKLDVSRESALCEEPRKNNHIPVTTTSLASILEGYRGVQTWCDILKRCSLRGRSGDDDRVLHGVVLLEGLDELGDGGALLADGDVDAVELLGLVVAVVPSLLVQHGVESDGSLSGLTITNDKLTLSTADGHHGVDGLETSLYGLVDGLTGQNAGGLKLGTAPLGGLEGTLSIDGVTESIDDTAEKSLADRNIDLILLGVAIKDGGMIRTISPVRLTVSPSLTNRSEPKSTTPTWPASKFMHMPLTPEANLCFRQLRGSLGVASRCGHTRRAPRPGHCSCRAHAQYRH